MADIELADELIVLQKRSDTAWAQVRAIQDRHGRPTRAGGWPSQAHAEWRTAWDEWGACVDAVRGAIDAWAQDSGQRPIDVDARLKGLVRGGKPPRTWPEAG